MSDITQNSTDIDQLITDQLDAGQPTRGKRSYCGNPNCSNTWHGKPARAYGSHKDEICPGSFNWPERLM
jgi:hypothetical protein